MMKYMNREQKKKIGYNNREGAKKNHLPNNKEVRCILKGHIKVNALNQNGETTTIN